MPDCFNLMLVASIALLIAGTVMRAPVAVRAAVFAAMLVSLAASTQDPVIHRAGIVIALAG